MFGGDVINSFYLQLKGPDTDRSTSDMLWEYVACK